MIKDWENIKKKLNKFLLLNFNDLINFTLIFKIKKYLKSTIKYVDLVN